MRIIVMDIMHRKKGKDIEVKLEYTIAGEYKTYDIQTAGKRHSQRIDYAVS